MVPAPVGFSGLELFESCLGFHKLWRVLTASTGKVDFVCRARFLGVAPSLSDGSLFLDAAGDKFCSEKLMTAYGLGSSSQRASSGLLGARALHAANVEPLCLLSCCG